MEDTLRGLVARIAETDTTFAETASIRDELKVDSVRALELVFEIERTFNVQFPPERLREVVTFADLVGVVRSIRVAA